jgi:hypothetical protein
LKFASALYTALIGREPTGNADVVNVAIPDAFTAPVPIVVVPSLKVTVPVGVPAPGALTVTVAVNVTDWFKRDGLTDELSAVVVFALLTTWDSPTDTLPLKFASPAYVAVNVLGPAVVKDKLHEPDGPAAVQLIVPSLTVTLPVGVPAPGAFTAREKLTVTG